MNRRWRVVGVLLVVWAGLLFVVGVSGQSGVPVNGAFLGNAVGWTFVGSSGGGCAYDVTTGYTINGSGKFGQGCHIASSPFRVGSGAVLDFWIRGSENGGSFTVALINAYTSQYIMTTGNISSNTAWSHYTVDLSFYAGQEVMLEWLDNSYTVEWLDDVSIAGVNVTPGGFQTMNGSFAGGMWGWVPITVSAATYVGGEGHTSLGALRGYEYSVSYSRAVTVDAPSFSFWWKSANSGVVEVYFYDFTSTRRSERLANVSGTPSVWTEVTIDSSGFMGHTGFFSFLQNNAYVDDICSALGCINGTPTPLPTSTVTPIPTWVGGGNWPYYPGTPLPIDWTQFPTPAPYPTFPPFPTAIYGVGTSAPVTFNGTAQPVYLVTPFPTAVPYFTQIPLATPIYGRDTPIPINWPTATMTLTPISVNTSVSNVSGGTPIAVSGSIGDHTNLVFTEGTGGRLFSGPSTNPVDVELTTRDLDFTWPIPLNLTYYLRFLIHYMYPTRFLLLGMDLLGPIYALGGVFFAVFLIRKLQKR